MRELPLSATSDFVTRHARQRDPVRAVVELVWNAIDAEADAVRVDLVRSDLDAIERVTVADDGHGITSDEVQSTFGRIGGSWKALATRSKNDKRGLHGKLGEGRLRAFALGSRVTWTSESVNAVGEREQVAIVGSTDQPEPFSWEMSPSNTHRTGTVVTALNEQERSLTTLLGEATLPTLTSHFAPVLLNDDQLSIVFDGVRLNPADEMLADTTVQSALDSDPTATIAIRIIEWRTGKHRAVYFGEDEERFTVEVSGAELENQAAFSAYVTWPGFDVDSLAVLSLSDMAPDPAGAVWRATKAAIREHFASRRRSKRRDQIDEWKTKGIYP
ncbi:ATP-binding protein [Microbacterium sp. MYb62]|uniref:ATP-binding protein n=1 Tax=Microbacterium sp. MYb62 TaxID=1848690 RepID=UPI002157AB38|nr:ATP-binding protein [Microbacterium sp. MYb62]